MSISRFKVEILVEVDTDDFPRPADGKLSLSLRDEITQCVEELPLIVNYVRVTKTGTVKNDDAEVWN